MRPAAYLAAVAALILVSAPARAETIQIVIDKLVFFPAEITVKVGDTVEWINKDPFVHTATVKGGWEVNIPAGKSAQRVMEEAGSFDYYCRFHPNMKGRIVSAP